MAVIMKIGIIVFGFAMILAGFWFHSRKKLAVNFAVFWAVLGILLALAGVVLPMWIWGRLFGTWRGIPFLCLGIILFIGGFLISMIMSRLIAQNRELAMQVALLLEEKERIELELGEVSERYEKAAVCY